MWTRPAPGVLPITLWMNMPSHHQDDLIRCVAATPGVDLQVIYDTDLAASRQEIGWEAGSRPYQHRFLSGLKPADAIRQMSASRNRVHIVNGIWAVPSFTVALLYHLARSGNPVFIYSEGSKADRSRSWARCAARTQLGRWVARNPRCKVLAVSKLAAEFYSSFGFPEDRIYPFGYFRDSDPQSRTARAGTLRVAYIGRLCSQKGLDVLLRALEPLWDGRPELALDVIGGGPDLPAIREYMAAHPSARIRLRGVLPSSSIPREISEYDLVVLPSRFDGWGVVVNEALAAAVPAIVSDTCGAADLIRHGVNGFVFPSGNPDALRECILEFAQKPAGERREMSSAAAATGESIHPRAAASYLIECVRHALAGAGEKPVPPWMMNNEHLLYS
jgi:glycosyltransferase involved in cell wall biosynthesis